MRRVAITGLTIMLLMTSASIAAASVPAKQHAVPKDACALVNDEQVDALVPSATSAPTPQAPNGVGCHWDDGSDAPTLNTLTVSVLKIPGVPVAQLKLSMQVDAKDNHGEVVKGVGTFATQRSVIPPNTEVDVLVKPLLLTVEFSGSGPVTDDQKAATLAIAKAVAKQL